MRARDLAGRALASEPGDADLLSLYGATFITTKGEDATQGIAALERADQIEPGRTDVFVALVSLHVRAGDRERAEAVARRAESLPDASAKAQIKESLVFLDLNESDDAVEARDLPKAIALLKSAREKTSRDALRARIDERIAKLEAAVPKAPKPKSKAPAKPAAKP